MSSVSDWDLQSADFCDRINRIMLINQHEAALAINFVFFNRAGEHKRLFSLWAVTILGQKTTLPGIALTTNSADVCECPEPKSII